MKCNYRSGCGATLQVSKFFAVKVEIKTMKYKIPSFFGTFMLSILFQIVSFQSFVFECSGLLKNRTDRCTDRCKNTLIGLTSTEEGRKMMNVS